VYEDSSHLRTELDRSRGVIRQAAARMRVHPFWGDYLDGFENRRRGVHLIILNEPAISRVLFGVKTLDVHGLRSGRPPFEEVARGDIVFIKARGGDICGLARVARALMFNEVVEEDWNRLLGAASSRTDYEEEDWSFVRDMKTRLALITLANVCTLPRSISFGNAGPKRWAVLKETRRPALARRYVSASDIKALGTRRSAAPSTKPRLREVS